MQRSGRNSWRNRGYAWCNLTGDSASGGTQFRYPGQRAGTTGRVGEQQPGGDVLARRQRHRQATSRRRQQSANPVGNRRRCGGRRTTVLRRRHGRFRSLGHRQPPLTSRRTRRVAATWAFVRASRKAVSVSVFLCSSSCTQECIPAGLIACRSSCPRTLPASSESVACQHQRRRHLRYAGQCGDPIAHGIERCGIRDCDLHQQVDLARQCVTSPHLRHS